MSEREIGELLTRDLTREEQTDLYDLVYVLSQLVEACRDMAAVYEYYPKVFATRSDDDPKVVQDYVNAVGALAIVSKFVSLFHDCARKTIMKTPLGETLCGLGQQNYWSEMEKNGIKYVKRPEAK